MASNFEVLKEMAKRNLDVRLSLLDNVTNMRLTHRGKDTNVTIGVYGNVIHDIMDGKLNGGLLLFNDAQYQAIAKELDAAALSNSQPTGK